MVIKGNGSTDQAHSLNSAGDTQRKAAKHAKALLCKFCFRKLKDFTLRLRLF